VKKLLWEYGVDEKTHDMETAENLLHIACRNKSDLRFFLVRNYPVLLQLRNVNGLLPLHVACQQNDLEFISWLFAAIVVAADRVAPPELPSEEMRQRTKSQDSMHSPPISVPSNRSSHNFCPRTRFLCSSLIEDSHYIPVKRMLVNIMH